MDSPPGRTWRTTSSSTPPSGEERGLQRGAEDSRRWRRSGRLTPYVLIVLGVENAPGGNGGSFVEIGVGGGVRAAVGYRWRKRNAPGR